MTLSQRRIALAAALITLGSMTALADTLVLRSGRSFRGELISVRDGRIEFRTDRDRLERFSVDEVERVEFDDRDTGRYRDDRDRDRDRDEDRGRGDGRPSGLREREIDVRANVAWTATNIEVRAGQDLWFDSRGEVRWGPGRKDGPEGEGGSPRNPARPIPSRPGAALIGKIGESGDPFFIGKDSGPIRVRGRGTLFLGINDDYLPDNTGSFRVMVYY